MTGGGGEGGYATRTPELPFSDAIRGGVTTIVGCLGTDGVTRSLAELLAKARAWTRRASARSCYTGYYAVPVQTLTGSIERDLLLIDKVDRRRRDRAVRSPVDAADLRRVRCASPREARRGGILSGKAGVVNVHMGDGRRGLDCCAALVAETEIPTTQFVPTHINRNPSLFEEGIAYAKAGGLVDFTTSTVPAFIDEGEVKCSRGLRRMLDAGVPVAQVTFTSDGQGSLPDFDAQGRLRAARRRPGDQPVRRGSRRGARRGACRSRRRCRSLPSNPARILKLRGKGELAAGRRRRPRAALRRGRSRSAASSRRAAG